MKKKSLGLNALLNGIRTVLNTLFPLITFPYISRVLSVENVGKYNFALSVIQYFLLIAALGISTYEVRERTKFRDDKKKFSIFANEIFTINIISTITAYILLVFTVAAVPKFKDYAVIIAVFSIEILFTTIGTEWIYSIYEEYVYITIRSIVFKVISIILLFLLVKKPDDYIVYAGITVFANAGSNILNFIHAKKYCLLKFDMGLALKRHLKPIMIIFASTVATTIYINSDTTMLGFMGTDFEVGIYSVSSKIYRIVKQMLAAILIVTIPRLSLLMGQKRIEEYKNILTQIFNVLVMLVLPSVTGLILLSKEVVLLISGKEYIKATNSLKLLSIALIFCIFGWIYNQCVLIPARKEKIVLIATLVSALANIAINFVCIPFWRENAVAFSTIFAEAIMMIVCVYVGRKIVRLNAGVAYNICTVCVGCIGIWLSCKFVKHFSLSSIATLVLSILLSCIVYGMCLILMRNKVIWTFFEKNNA